MTANVIIRQILLKRGNTAATSTYTGPVGELVVDTDLKTVRVQDGITAGGTLVATPNDISDLRANITAANVQINSLWANAAGQADALSVLTANAAAQSAALSVLTSNAAVQSLGLDVLTANAGSQSSALATLTANAAAQSLALDVLTTNAASQTDALSVLTANAAAQSLALDVLTANAASQTTALSVLTANAASQSTSLDTLTANAAAQSLALDVLTANAASQANTLTSLLGNTGSIATEVSGLWSNAAVQSGEMSSLRANITAANAAIVTANTNMKTYVDSLSSERTGNITFTGRTIGADSNGESGITFDSAGNGEIHIMDNTGINNPNPEHWLHIGNFAAGAGLNTGDLAIDFNNGEDTLSGHVTWTWDWWDTSLPGYKGTHNDGSGTHSKFVLLKDHDQDNPLIAFDYASSNVTVGYIAGTKFTGNVGANYLSVGHDIQYANGTSYLASVNANITAANAAIVTANSAIVSYIDTLSAAMLANVDAANAAIVTANSAVKSYIDTQISGLVNGAPAILDTLNELATSLGNNASLSTSLTNLIANVQSNVGGANAAIAILDANIGTVTTNITTLFGNAGSQATEINDLRANITAANLAMASNAAAQSAEISDLRANITAANAAIVSANLALKNYVDDVVAASTGNIVFDGNTISTTAGTDNGIVLNSAGNGEIYITDYTGIDNANPGWWLHVGDALKNIDDGQARRGTIAIDYASGVPYVDGQPPLNTNGLRGTVVFDWRYWNSGDTGTYNKNDDPYREFGLFKDGIVNPGSGDEKLFVVDLDTKVFSVNALSVDSRISAANITLTSNIVSPNFLFANGVNILSTIASYGNTEVAAYLVANPQAGTYSNSNVASYLIDNPQAGTYSNSNVASYLIDNPQAGTYSNSNVASYLTSQNINSYGNTEVAAYLIDNPQAGTYSNTNVASYLSTTTVPHANVASNIVVNLTSTSYAYPLLFGNVGNSQVDTSSTLKYNPSTLALSGAQTGSFGQSVQTTSILAAATSVSVFNTTATTISMGGAASTVNVGASNVVATFGSGTGNISVGNISVTSNVTVSGMAVTMPNRPAFRISGGTPAWWTTSNTNFKDSAITVDYNQGNYFNSTTGVFTAPVAGLYNVTLNARIGSVNAQGQIMVIKNGLTTPGNVAVMWEADTNTGTAVHFGVCSTVKLEAGDWLSANITAGNIQFDQNDSWTVTYIG